MKTEEEIKKRIKKKKLKAKEFISISNSFGFKKNSYSQNIWYDRYLEVLKEISELKWVLK